MGGGFDAAPVLPSELRMKRDHRRTTFTDALEALVSCCPRVDAAVIVDDEAEWVDYASRVPVDQALVWAAQPLSAVLAATRASTLRGKLQELRLTSRQACLTFFEVGEGYWLMTRSRGSALSATAQRRVPPIKAAFLASL